MTKVEKHEAYAEAVQECKAAFWKWFDEAECEEGTPEHTAYVQAKDVEDAAFEIARKAGVLVRP